MERLAPDGDGAGDDRDDVGIVRELLAALLALFLVLRDEALDELDRMAADASRLLVDELDRHVRAGGRDRTRDHDGTALLVEVADLDRLEARVGRPAGATHIGDVVGHRLVRGRRLAGLRRLSRLGRGLRGLGRRLSGLGRRFCGLCRGGRWSCGLLVAAAAARGAQCRDRGERGKHESPTAGSQPCLAHRPISSRSTISKPLAVPRHLAPE